MVSVVHVNHLKRHESAGPAAGLGMTNGAHRDGDSRVPWGGRREHIGDL